MNTNRYYYSVPGLGSDEPQERQMFLAHVLCGKQMDYGFKTFKEQVIKRPPTGYDSVKV